MKKAIALSLISLVVLLCGCVGEQDGKIDVPFTASLSAPDLSINGLKAELNGTNILFTLSYSSGKERFLSFFNPPDGSIVRYFDENGLKQGVNTASFEVDAAILSTVSQITMRFSMSVDPERDRNFIFLKPGMRYAALLEKAKNNPNVQTKNASNVTDENPAKIDIAFTPSSSQPDLKITKLQAEINGSDIRFTLDYMSVYLRSFSFYNPPGGSILMYIENGVLKPDSGSISFDIPAAKLAAMSAMNMNFWPDGNSIFLKIDKKFLELIEKAKANPASEEKMEGIDEAESPNKVEIDFEREISAQDLKINSLHAEIDGSDVLFTLEYQTGMPRFYSFFNPPEGSIIRYFDENGLKPEENKISFKIEAAKLASVNAITMRFSRWEDEESDRNFIFLNFDQKLKNLLKNVTPEAQNNRKNEEIAFDLNYKTNLNPAGQLGIVRHPSAGDFNRGSLTALPTYNEKSRQMWQIDLRSTDVSSIDLTGRLSDLMHADFDSKTKWPVILPKGFDPLKLMELGKNPGLHVRDLHKKGITGKGIGIAIIDQGLLVDHVEYADRIKSYEEIHSADEVSAMHGPAVASIAVGKTVGVAPEADLYYIAETHSVFKGEGKSEWELSWLAKSIDRIVEINEILPEGKRIRVISISLGVGTQLNNGQKALDSIRRAREKGIYTAYVGSDEYSGMGRVPTSDPDDFKNYIPGAFLSNAFYSGRLAASEIWIPMDSRCTASPTGTEDYVYYSEGGMSWTVPYVAGLYALACQVKPDVTPELFWDIARKTGSTNEILKDGKAYKFGKIVDPVKLIESLSK